MERSDAWVAWCGMALLAGAIAAICSYIGMTEYEPVAVGIMFAVGLRLATI
jgi:hypothetical protein